MMMSHAYMARICTLPYFCAMSVLVGMIGEMGAVNIPAILECSGNLTHYTKIDCGRMGMDAPTGACFYTLERKQFDTCDSICNGVKTGSYIGMRSEASCKSRCKEFYDSSCKEIIPSTASPVTTKSQITETALTSTAKSVLNTTLSVSTSSSAPLAVNKKTDLADVSSANWDKLASWVALALGSLIVVGAVILIIKYHKKCYRRKHVQNRGDGENGDNNIEMVAPLAVEQNMEYMIQITPEGETATDSLAADDVGEERPGDFEGVAENYL